MTTLTLPILAVMIVCALQKNGYWRALAIGGGTPIGAFLMVGENAVPTFYAAAIGAAIGLLLRLLRRTHRFEQVKQVPFPGRTPLALFLVWAAVVTVLAPLFFGGTTVLPAPGGLIGTLPMTGLTLQNLAQLGYLILGISVVFFLARSAGVGPGVIGIATTIVTVLCFWRFLSQNVGLPFPEGFFDNNRTFAFIETEPGGAPRFRGIFSEPAGLATSCLVTIAYSVSRAMRVQGLHRVGLFAVAAMAAIMAASSTAATFVVAAVALVGLVGLAFLTHFLLRRGAVRPFMVAAACVAAIGALWILPLAANMVEQVVSEKVASTSFDDRSTADNISYSIVLETFGFGVGLGAHRPSSFAAGLLSTTGVLGAALFATAVLVIIRRAMPVDEYRPVIWALIALLITKVISGPDLADTSGILWLSLGVLAFAGTLTRAAPERRPQSVPAIPAKQVPLA